MAQKPIAMEQLKQILQLQADGTSIREIARRVGISRNSVRKYLSRFSASVGLELYEWWGRYLMFGNSLKLHASSLYNGYLFGSTR
jgi:transposase